MTQQSHSWAYMQRKQKFKRTQAAPMFTALFIYNSQDIEAM